MDLWDDWAVHHKKLGLHDVRTSKDGIADEAKFNACSQRVLFILRDTNNYDGDMREGMKQGLGGWFRTIATWATGIIRNFPEYEKFEDNQLKESLQSVALINVKKVVGGYPTNMEQVNAFAYTDRILLRKQIEEINPTVIVGCGTYHILPWLLEPNVSPYEISGDKFMWGSIPVVRMRHPLFANVKNTYEELKTILK